MEKPTENQRIGALGEDIAVKYLENKGYLVIDRNYLKKCGEIDIIAKKGKILHFVEVKTVSGGCNEYKDGNVSRETDNYRAEDNIHPNKLKRLARTVQVYLLEKHPKNEQEWAFDAIIVKLDTKSRKAKVRFLQDLAL